MSARTTPKRRLSSGSVLSLNSVNKNDIDDDELDDDEEEEVSTAFTKKSSARRRSSFGIGKSPAMHQLNPQEQQRIAEMYKTVIQMATDDVSC